MRRLLVLSFAFILSSTGAHAQTTPSPDRRAAVVADIVGAARRAVASPTPVANPFSGRITPGERQLVASYLMAANGDRAAYARILHALEAGRVDKQVGAPPNAAGGTSLAMKGLAPRIFGLAVERGALTRDVSGTTVTFRLSPVGAVKALQGTGLVDLNDDYARSVAQRFAGRFSLAATFDVSRGSDPGVFTGNDQQLSSVAARFTFVNRRDPASPTYAPQWLELLSGSTTYQSSVAVLNDTLSRWAAYTAWEIALDATVRASVEMPFVMPRDVDAAAAMYTAILTKELGILETTPMPAEVRDALDAYAEQLTKVQSQIDKIYKFAGKGPLVTLDVNLTRDASVPDLYVATGIWEVGLGSSRKTDFTFNGGASIYKTTPTGAEHQLKSVNFSLQLEHPLGKALAAPTLTFAARYSYLPKDTVAGTGVVAATSATAAATDAASVAPAPKGHVGFFQAKLTIPIKDSGAKVPISVTASNRTELIKEKDVRGSIGITFDLDTFMSALTGQRP